MENSSSIVAGCIVLRSSISLLLSDVQHSTAGIKHANHDLRRLPSELASLHLTVGAIQSSCSRTSSIPITLRTNLRTVMASCDHTVKELRETLAETRASLSVAESSAMRKLLPGLEAHKSAIQIALELLLVITTEESSSSQILHSELGQSSHQPQTTDQVFFMLREIRVLQFQVAQLAQAQNSSGTSLQRFLEDVSEYAESVYQASDGNSMRFESAREDDAESDIDDFHSAKESFLDSSRPSSQIDPQTTDNFELMPVDTTDSSNTPNPGRTLLQSNIQTTLIPSSSSLSEHSAWSYASIRLRISNRLYSVRTASDTTRNIISAITFLDPAIRAVRLARQQGVLPLSEDQKARIDRQILFAEQSMDRAASLVEPARVDLQTRAKVRFVRKVRFVLRDSPRIQACFEQLSAAGAGLNAAANVLYGTQLMADTDSNSISTMNIPAPPYSLSLGEGC